MSNKVVILGAGPSGLTLARLLEVKGIPYTVYERDESPTSRRPGGCLDLHAETGQRAIRVAGLTEPYEKVCRRGDATTLRVADKMGNLVLDLNTPRDAPEIDRRELRQLFLNALPTQNVVWGKAVSTVVMGEEGPVVHFDDGTEVKGCRLVVGADGTWSKVRPLVRICKTPTQPSRARRIMMSETCI
jgi:2-polyprenyl-6-methoxyphenol hydroxylase-like FAD-dependent oxidoreductase